jgi:hypothetical protein
MIVAEISLSSRRLACEMVPVEKRMKQTGRFTNPLWISRICFLLMLPLIFILEACTSPSYQPIVAGNFRTAPQQGYSDYQIDERTYREGYAVFKLEQWTTEEY